MAKLAQNYAKYIVHAKMHASGIIEKPDVIGAIFGQTEGLLGSDLDLREMQKTGRIGRIEVNIKNKEGKSEVDIIVPSSLDLSETSLIAASLETIEKVGPCEAKVSITKLEDIRSEKRKYVIDRAKEILRKMIKNEIPDSEKICDDLKQSVRSLEISDYFGLSCGPNIEDVDEIIIVEGRADVINLLRAGIKNVIAIEGSKIPKSVIELTRRKTTTAFLDGDRGGDLDLKKLLAVADIDFVARAEEGVEVEDLTQKEIYKALREKVPINQINNINKDRGMIRRSRRTMYEKKKINYTEAKTIPNKKLIDFFKEKLNELIGTRAAFFVDKNINVIGKIPFTEIGNSLDDFRNVFAIIFDGKINQEIIDVVLPKKIKYIVGIDIKENVNTSNINVLTLKDLERK